MRKPPRFSYQSFPNSSQVRIRSTFTPPQYSSPQRRRITSSRPLFKKISLTALPVVGLQSLKRDFEFSDANTKLLSANPLVSRSHPDTYNPLASRLPLDTCKALATRLHPDTYNPLTSRLPLDTYNPLASRLHPNTYNLLASRLPLDTCNALASPLHPDTYNPLASPLHPDTYNALASPLHPDNYFFTHQIDAYVRQKNADIDGSAEKNRIQKKRRCKCPSKKCPQTA